MLPGTRPYKSQETQRKQSLGLQTAPKYANFIVLDQPVSAEFYPNTRANNLTLFPYWYVTLHLDKTYPGGVNVIAVGVWGDSGEVANTEPLSGQT